MSYLRRTSTGLNDISWNGGTFDIPSTCNVKVLYSDTPATDGVDLIRQKAKLCDDGSSYGVYFILGGWQGRSFGNSLVLKYGGNKFSVAFIGQGTLFIGLWTKDDDTVSMGFNDYNTLLRIIAGE